MGKMEVVTKFLSYSLRDNAYASLSRTYLDEFLERGGGGTLE